MMAARCGGKGVFIALLLILSEGVFVQGGFLDSIKNVFGVGAPTDNIVIPSGQENLPNYFRIETQVVRLDN
jgi:hypothetical protein